MSADFIFPDIRSAMDYVLKLEHATMQNDLTRKYEPQMHPWNDNPFGSPYSCYFNEAEDSQFIMTRLQSGRFSLKPNLKSRKFLYRGQSEYYDNCHPSLFRNNKDYFLDDMIYAQELYILILSHPLCQLLDLGLWIDNICIRVEMNIAGLAQHYYNPTSMLDLTSDPEVAEFFAVSDYDKDSDSYHPVIDNKIGCIYFYDINIHKDFLLDPRTHLRRLSTMGLQVFPRSELQHAFLFNMGKEENFNDSTLFPQVHSVKFYHHPDVSKTIFDKMDKGAKLFPEDILQHHWKIYNKDRKRVSLQAVHWNVHENRGESISSIKRKLDYDYGISVRNYKPCFTEDELQGYYQDIKNGSWEQFVNKIFIPNDSNNYYREKLLDIPRKSEYRWAFEPGNKCSLDYSKGYLLKEYEEFLS